MSALFAAKARKLTEELAELIKKQSDALQSAPFLPMSKAEAKAFDERHERIETIRQLLQDSGDSGVADSGSRTRF